MKQKEGFFTGSSEKLFQYWQNENRAKKFLEGGTRTPMVKTVLNEINTNYQRWLDIGSGTGFIQKQIFNQKIRIHWIALDISWPMLNIYQVQEVERIAGSGLQVPFRKSAFSLISTFFCLSDYPDLNNIITDLLPLIERGELVLVDYATGDGYWELRKKAHGKEIAGNINLRSEEDLNKIELKKMGFSINKNKIYTFETDTGNFPTTVKLPDTITRKFFLFYIDNLQN